MFGSVYLYKPHLMNRLGRKGAYSQHSDDLSLSLLLNVILSLSKRQAVNFCVTGCNQWQPGGGVCPPHLAMWVHTQWYRCLWGSN